MRNRNETSAAEVGQGESKIYPEQDQKPQEALEQESVIFHCPRQVTWPHLTAKE